MMIYNTRNVLVDKKNFSNDCFIIYDKEKWISTDMSDD